MMTNSAGIWRRIGAVSAVAAGLLMGAVAPAGATTMVPANLAQLSESAENAFIVKIESVETTTPAEGRSYDIVSGTIVEPVFGNLKTSQTISWNQFRLGQKVMLPGMPKYKIGQEYLIFLTGKGPGTGMQSPVGLGQGTFEITRNPQTGAAMARNAYMNSTLASGLNTEAVARDMVARDPKTRSFSGPQREAEIKKIQMQLRGRTGGSLERIKEAAKFFHSQKQAGKSPAADYRSTGPTHLIR